MIKDLHYSPATIDSISTFPTQGPWSTKSRGDLNVLFGINFSHLQKVFFHYEQSELNKINYDIRGLRSYRIENLSKGSIGGREWHRLRNELVFVIQGSVKWTCEDTGGRTVEYILDKSTGLWIPPLILHTYEVLENNSSLLVIANTLFIPDDPTTYDTFSAEEFENLINAI